MAIPFWDPPSIFGTTDGLERLRVSTNPWDTMTMNGDVLPGLVTLTGKKGRRIDKKKSPGRDNATLTHLGYEPAEISVQLRMWTPDQLAAWELILPRLQPQHSARSPAPQPMSCEHPALALAGIHDLAVVDISLPVDDHVPGVKVVTLTLWEFKPGGQDVTNTAKKADYRILEQNGFKTSFDAPAIPSPAASVASATK